MKLLNIIHLLLTQARVKQTILYLFYSQLSKSDNIRALGSLEFSVFFHGLQALTVAFFNIFVPKHLNTFKYTVTELNDLVLIKFYH